MGSFPLFTRKCSKSQIRLTGPTRSKLGDAVAEVIGSAGIAACLGHVEQPCGGQGRKLLQDVGDERDERVEHGGASWALAFTLDASLAQHALDGGVMDTQLSGDGAHAPVLGEEVAQNLRLAFVIDRHGV